MLREGGDGRPPSTSHKYGVQSLQSSSTTVAMDAVKAIRLSMAASLESINHPIPREILVNSGPHLNLKRWSLLLRDEDMRVLSGSALVGAYHLIDAAQDSVADMFSEFRLTRYSDGKLLSVNISGAAHVTDSGLTSLVRSHPTIRHLDISGCKGVTDFGVREVGLSCKYLEYLNLSAIAVVGSGLVAIAEGCSLMTHLNVSRCRSLLKFGITKVFYACRRIEVVDISYLNEIGDNEVRVLALNCPHLREIKAGENVSISDTGIIAIAEHCPDIEFIDVSRSQLSFKISDASLSSLGERSKSLRVFVANGCEHITDVGLTWLSTGCKYLERIELASCAKVVAFLRIN